jgi:hypothetical protein
MGTQANQISTGDNLINDLYYRVTSTVSSNKTKCVTFKTLQSLNPISDVTTSNYSTAGKTYSFAQAGTTTIVEKYETYVSLTACSGFSVNTNYSLKTLDSHFYPFRFSCTKFGGNTTIWLGSISGSITKSALSPAIGNLYAEISIYLDTSVSTLVRTVKVKVTPGGTVNFTCDNNSVTIPVDLSLLIPAPNIYNGTFKCGVDGCGYVSCFVIFKDDAGNIFDPQSTDYIKITNTPMIHVYCPDKLAKHNTIRDLTAVVPMYLGIINKTGGNAINTNYVRLQAYYANGTNSYIARRDSIDDPNNGRYSQWHYFIPLYNNDTITLSTYGTTAYAKVSAGETSFKYNWTIYGNSYGGGGGDNILQNYNNKMQLSTSFLARATNAKSLNANAQQPVDGIRENVFLPKLLRDNKAIYLVTT